MTADTWGVKVMKHIRAHEEKMDENYAVMALTQLGMSKALGISRAHCAVVLGNLETRGLIVGAMRYCNDAPNRTRLRRVYRTTGKNGMALTGKYMMVPVSKIAELQAHVKAAEKILRYAEED